MKPRPLKLTLEIGGELAEEIRKYSRQMGVRPATIIRWQIKPGLLSTGHSDEAKEFQLATASRFVGLSPETTAFLHIKAKEAEAEYIARLRAGKEIAR